jgi:hypothetical protein
MSVATKDDEHAVSTTKLAPVSPNTNDMRFAVIEEASPVPENGEES